VDPLALRYLFLTSRYRHKLDYSEESVDGAAAALASLRARLRALGPPPDDGPWAAPGPLRSASAGDRPEGIATGPAGHGGADPREVVGRAGVPASADRAHEPGAPLSAAGRALRERFVAAIDDDLDLPGAIAVTRETLRAPLPDDERRWLLLDFDFVLGLDLDRVWVEDARERIPAAIQARLDERSAARAARDYARSDTLRDELGELGWDVVDGPDGSSVRAREPVR
jgi:cysteinyl-tRNA synthetase